jgi:hypothetical protein
MAEGELEGCFVGDRECEVGTCGVVGLAVLNNERSETNLGNRLHPNSIL